MMEIQTGIKLYLQSTKEIDKETDKLDISVFNTKDIIYHFLSLANKYVWERLSWMVGTATCVKNIFRVIEQIQLSKIKEQAHGHFGLLGIGNVTDTLPSHFSVSHINPFIWWICNWSSSNIFFSVTGWAQIRNPRKFRAQLQKHLLRNLGFIVGYMNEQNLGIS